jgi:hypothetical protein
LVNGIIVVKGGQLQDGICPGTAVRGAIR